ncbi:hypothetical protein [Candidatus Solirubrobacter pratensis]|uniref:hypothetical protein n=1 Tax=Candidatus Solirubrobacter pratensis TaxID=1298857 RepID=UPI00040CA175|nr:hypothetical protein [Candidatus Solirubrobacter pratensis]
MTAQPHTFEFIGTARQAGANVVHTVTVDGRDIPGGVRRSAHRYPYAFVKRTTWRWEPGQAPPFAVKRWSRSNVARSGEIVVAVESI